MAHTILLLSGTKEAEDYAANFMADQQDDIRLIVSLAGRTKSPSMTHMETRIGGFGGLTGLVAFIQQENISKIIDATHPFATRISKHAKSAAAQTGIPLEIISRPEWTEQSGDVWIKAKHIDHACELLPSDATTFLALGSQYISAFEKRDDCKFVVRMIDAPEVPLAFKNCDLILSKPLCSAQQEMELFKLHKITHLVARNSGGERSYAKIEAARLLSLPIIMIDRPQS